LGVPTRGTTNPNRLRRMDRWIAHSLGPLIRSADDPLVIDLGYGASAVTAVELATRMHSIRADVRVLGIEIDQARVDAALRFADPPRLDFVRGGFELAGRTPILVRAANVLRQYPVDAADEAWSTVTARLAPGGLLIDGTCDEIGRRSAWITLDQSGPRWLTLAAHVDSLHAPSELAERLPKALIHRNVPGERIHAFLNAFDAVWATASPIGAFGARQRWIAACTAMADAWPIRGRRERWRLGEITVEWAAVAPLV
jgi:hypothetical protein